MIFFILACFFLSDVSARLIQINRDSYNITNVDPTVFIDPNFTQTKAKGLLTASEATAMSNGFFAWMLSEWGIDVPAGIYVNSTTGYLTPVGVAFPSLVANEGYKVEYDSRFPLRRFGDWFVATGTWFFQFTTSYTIQSGPHAGAVMDPQSSLGYGYTFYLRNGANWNYPFNKEAQLCYSESTGKFFPNMYSAGGNFGGRDSLIRFICLDESFDLAGERSFMSVLNMYRRNLDGTVDEFKRSTLRTLTQ